MNFTLTAPCANCPFRTDITFHLRPERVAQICSDLFAGGTFACHKTTTNGGGRGGRHEQHCAGAMILLERHERPNQMMRIAERLGMYDHTKLDMTAPVFETPEAMRERMEELER